MDAYTQGTPFTLKWFGRSGIMHRPDTILEFNPRTGIVKGNFFEAHYTNVHLIRSSINSTFINLSKPKNK